MRRLSPYAVGLGGLGLIPFILCGLWAVGSNPVRSIPALEALIAWGGVILSFLGGVHWGFCLSTEAPRAEGQRLALGVLPAIFGWVAVVIGLVSNPILALVILIASFIAAIVVEGRGWHLAIVPSGYVALRWVLTVVVVAILTTVLVLKAIGAHVLL